MTIPEPGIWYFWPVTTMTVAALTGIHLNGRARSQGRAVVTRLGLTGAGVLALGLPFLALATSLDIGCTDTGSAVRLDPGLDVVAALTSSVFLWHCYLTAGTPLGRATLWVTITLLGTSLAVLIEFYSTWFELEHHCNELGDFRQGHLLVGVVVASYVGLVLRGRMGARRHPRSG